MMAYGLVGKPVDSCFEDAEKSGKLHLSNRNLRELPKSCANYDMEDVFLIELANNKLKKVPEALRNCRILTKLNLHNNFLREFNSELKHLYTLKELILSRNSLTVFPLIITTYKLELLDISCNLISIIPEDIKFLEKLKVLDLSSNYLQKIPTTIGQLKKLRALNLSRNKLDHVPDELQHCKLMKLDLSFNKLSVIPSSFRHMMTLQDINLESNPLRYPPAKICSLGKAHIFKFLSLLAQGEGEVTQEELEMQKRFRETQERQFHRPVSVKSNFEDYDIDNYSPTISQLSISTPTITVHDDYRMTTPDIQQANQRLDSQNPDYNSIYMDFVKKGKNPNNELDGYSRHSPPDNAVLRSRSSRRSDTKRRSSQYDTEQKPVLSMYATLPRNFRRPTTPSEDSEDGTGIESGLRIMSKVRPVLRMSPYMRRPYDNYEEHNSNHPVLDGRGSFENSQEGGQKMKPKQKQFAQVSRAESTRSSSTSGSYFGAPFSYAANLRRSSSNKYIDHTPDVSVDDRSRDKNSNPQNKDAPKRSESPGSEGSTVSDTSTPKASPEPPDAFSPIEPQKPMNNEKSPTPPPPPPRTFTTTPQLIGKLSSEKGQVAKLSIEKGKPAPKQESDRYFKSKKKSSSNDEDSGNLTIRRREYNVHLISSQIEYIVKEVKERMGIDIENFETSIRDGVLACQLVNLVQQDLVTIHIPENNKILSTRQVTLNIEKFLEGCQALGVPSNYMCSAADIIQGQDLSKVLKNFIYLLNSSAV